jgi:hypothetical protein
MTKLRRTSSRVSKCQKTFADLLRAKIGRIEIGSSAPLRKRKSIFTSLTFNSFEGDWRNLVDQQDPNHFSLDPYLMLERCKRVAGHHAEADKIYRNGRKRETRLAFVQRRPTTFIRGMLWSFFAGYGVRPFRSAIFCALLIALGVVVFWPNDALYLIGKAGNSGNVTQISKPQSRVVSNINTIQLFGDFSTWMLTKHQRWLKQLGLKMSTLAPLLDHFTSRLAYSVDEFIPVDLGIAELYHPAPGWRQLYNAFHILSGWILIPLLVAAMTGFLGKR